MKPAERPARTWLVLAVVHPTRNEEVDHLARGAEWGLSYETEEGLPPYLGVWTDPDHGRPWHVYSDYPPSHHEGFGWRPTTPVEGS